MGGQPEKQRMRAVVTGQIGVDKKPYLKAVADQTLRKVVVP